MLWSSTSLVWYQFVFLVWFHLIYTFLNKYFLKLESRSLGSTLGITVSQENYYQKLTWKRAPLRYSDKDIHVQINQEYKLTILGSELERTKHLNFFVFHIVKRPVENEKKIWLVMIYQEIKLLKSSRRRLIVGLPLLKPNS